MSGFMGLSPSGSVLMSMTPVLQSKAMPLPCLGIYLESCWSLEIMLLMGPFQSITQAMVKTGPKMLLLAMSGSVLMSTAYV